MNAAEEHDYPDAARGLSLRVQLQSLAVLLACPNYACRADEVWALSIIDALYLADVHGTSTQLLVHIKIIQRLTQTIIPHHSRIVETYSSES